MYYKRLLKDFNNSSDLKCINLNNIEVIYLESLCSGDRINEYVLKNITLNKHVFLKDNISGSNIVFIDNYELISFYLLNGFVFVTDGNDLLVCEVKASLNRSIDTPTVETSVNGPKDSFNENILTNLGLIKRRLKSNKLCNIDYDVGKYTKTKVSLLYIDGITKKSLINYVNKRLKKINVDGLIDIEELCNIFYKGNVLPNVLKSERPDRVSSALLDGKIVLIADNSPFALILPAFFGDFINPEGDKYANYKNINFLKFVRLFCLFMTIFLPSLYIALLNYNPESIPLKLLLSFQSGRSGVPFPSYFEVIFMIILCVILRESDIRFPTSYGSSISILGALLLGEAAVNSNIASPIMIIIIGLTFISGLIFNNGEIINGLRYYRFLVLLLSIFLGMYGLLIGFSIFIIDLISSKSLFYTYSYPIIPFDKNYFFSSLFYKNKKNNKRSKLLSNNSFRGDL